MIDDELTDERDVIGGNDTASILQDFHDMTITDLKMERKPWGNLFVNIPD